MAVAVATAHGEVSDFTNHEVHMAIQTIGKAEFTHLAGQSGLSTPFTGSISLTHYKYVDCEFPMRSETKQLKKIQNKNTFGETQGVENYFTFQTLRDVWELGTAGAIDSSTCNGVASTCTARILPAAGPRGSEE